MTKPWVYATGQRWKLVVFVGLMLLSMTSFLFMVLALNGVSVAAPIGELRSFLWGLALGSAGVVWLCASVRCSRCHGRPAWYLVRKSHLNRWFVLLLKSTGCPSCGDQPGAEASRFRQNAA
jgi:hypothetical protein